MKIRRWLSDMFGYAGVTKEEYEGIRPAVQERNREMLREYCVIAGGIFLALFAASFFVEPAREGRGLYLSLVLLVLLLLVCSGRTRGVSSSVYNYLFLTMIYGFGIVLGTYQSVNNSATTFCVLLFAAPLLFINSPRWMSLYLILVTGVFCSCSAMIKTPELAGLDRLNAVSFLALGIAVNATMTGVQIRELVQRRVIERAKDMDDLTKLLTKAAVEREVSRYLAEVKKQAAFLIIDLDNFKHANDTYGHAYGDAVLYMMADCIRQTFHDGELNGRFGGDEFIVFLPQVKNREAVVEKVELLVRLMRDQIVLPEKARSIQGSIGIAMYPADGSDYESLFKRADEALYESKRQGKDCYTFYFEVGLEKS